MQYQILDIEGERIQEIDLIIIFKEIIFIKPFVIKDIIKRKRKTPEIKVFEDINILTEIDFAIYAKELEDNEKWAKRQRYSMHLRPVEAPIEKTWKKLIKLPAKHYIEMDVNNSKVRVTGDFVDLKEQGIWIDY